MIRSSKEPDWPLERTLRVLKQLLESLQAFKGKNHREMESEEDAWTQSTEGAMVHGFGEDSHNVGHFRMAHHAGTHSMMGISEYQRQVNHEKRIAKFEATLRGSID